MDTKRLTLLYQNRKTGQLVRVEVVEPTRADAVRVGRAILREYAGPEYQREQYELVFMTPVGR